MRDRLFDQPEPIQTKQLKVLLVGDCGVGKSSIAARYAFNTYQPRAGRVREDVKTYQASKEVAPHVFLSLMVCNQEVDSFLKANDQSFDMLVYVYDACYKPSLDQANRWADAFKKIANPGAIKVLMGNRIDVEASVPVTAEYAKRYSKYDEFFRVSAKLGEHIDSYFAISGRMVLEEQERLAALPAKQSKCTIL